MRTFRRNFTLIEVVVAMAILTAGLSSFFGMAFMAQKRLMKAQDKWERFHMLSEAAEYMLMEGCSDPALPPEDIWNYPGYEIVCTYEDAVDIPEDLDGLPGQAKLKCMVLELVNLAGSETVDSLRVERIDYGDCYDTAE